MPKKRSVCPRYSKQLQRMSKRLKVPQSPVLGPSAAESPKNVEARAETDAIVDAIIGVDYGKPGGDETAVAYMDDQSRVIVVGGRQAGKRSAWNEMKQRMAESNAIEGQFEVVKPHVPETLKRIGEIIDAQPIPTDGSVNQLLPESMEGVYPPGVAGLVGKVDLKDLFPKE